MRMRHLALVFAAAIAGIATQYGTATQSATLFVETMNVMEMQNHADKNLPEMVIDNPV